MNHNKRLLLPGGQYTLSDSQVVALIYDDSNLKEASAMWGITTGTVWNLRKGKTGRTATPFFRKHIERANALRQKTFVIAEARIHRKISQAEHRAQDLKLLAADAAKARRHHRGEKKQ